MAVQLTVKSADPISVPAIQAQVYDSLTVQSVVLRQLQNGTRNLIITTVQTGTNDKGQRVILAGSADTTRIVDIDTNLSAAGQVALTTLVREILGDAVVPDMQSANIKPAQEKI